MPENHHDYKDEKNHSHKDRHNHQAHHDHRPPWKKHRLNMGQWAADRLAEVAGSWGFIIGFFIFLLIWIGLNLNILWMVYYTEAPFDPFPFILLNLFLSCLAAIQAPVILMSQNRAAQRDRQQATRDYYINRKAEKEIKMLQIQMLELKELLGKQSLEKETQKIEDEIAGIQQELENMSKTLQIE